MNNRIDELIKSLAQSVTRRTVLKKFGLGLAGMSLACSGLENKAAAQSTCLPSGYACKSNNDCCSGRCVTYPAQVGWPRRPAVKACG